MSLDEQIKALADAYNRVNGPGSGFAFGDGAAKARELLVKTSDEHRLRRIWIGDACDEWALSPVDGWDEYCPVTELIAEHARADRLEAQVDQIGGIVLEAMRHLQIGMDGCGGQLWVGEHVVDAIKTLSGALKIARAALAAREGEE